MFRIGDKNTTKYDIAFIGDSFTEAIGVEYDSTFVGLLAKAHPKLKVANLGVASYAPSVYLKKVECLLEKAIEFDHLIVMVDTWDLLDEALHYEEREDGSLINYYGNPVANDNS